MTYTSGTGLSGATTVVAPVTDSHQSAVAWAAIFAGALTTLAVTLLLQSFGVGMGFAATSPWPGVGASATTFAIFAAIWLMIVQWISAALGGYLTGRLRKKWAGAHTHEAFFRDTAHGFIAWALATMVTAGLIALVAAGGIAGASRALGDSGVQASIADHLLRPQTVDASTAPNAEGRAEVTRLLASGATSGGMTSDDRAYLSRVVAARAGVDQAEADRRISAAVQQVDDARKAAAKTSFFVFFSLLVGAFIASVAAAYGGSQRDELEDFYARGEA